MEDKYILESLASDLKRVALGLYRGSNVMARRFIGEALRRKNEIQMDNLPYYIKNILLKLDQNIDSDNALMYSTLIQNYTVYNKS